VALDAYVAKAYWNMEIDALPYLKWRPIAGWERTGSKSSYEGEEALVTSKSLKYVGDALAGVPVPKRRDAATFAPAFEDR
jgi:hypothetical protein